jgi:hypothetical protein
VGGVADLVAGGRADEGVARDARFLEDFGVVVGEFDAARPARHLQELAPGRGDEAGQVKVTV